jgi:hypothetical protein
MIEKSKSPESAKIQIPYLLIGRRNAYSPTTMPRQRSSSEVKEAEFAVRFDRHSLPSHGSLSIPEHQNALVPFQKHARFEGIDHPAKPAKGHL